MSTAQRGDAAEAARTPEDGVLADPTSVQIWSELWLAELERRSAGTLENEAELSRRTTRALGRVTVLQVPAEDGRRAFAGAGVHLHPLTGRSETVLNHLVAQSGQALRALLSLPPVQAETVELETAAQVDPQTSDILHELGFRPTVLTLRRSTGAEKGTPPDLFDVHHVRPEEYDFVHDCLATALSRGLDSAAPAVDLREWARSRFTLSGDVVCLVGTLDGEPVCHGLGIARPDRYSGRTVLYVVDVFVVPEQHNRGFSRLVSSELLWEAAQRGHRVLESDVALGERSEALREGLRGAGWSEDRMRWRRSGAEAQR